jgi:hypothetical protein
MIRKSKEIVAPVLVPGYCYLRRRITIAPERMGMEVASVPII